jgi:hypothetical protein
MILRAVAIVLMLGATVAAAPATQPARDAFDGHLEKLRTRLPGDGFTVVVQPPFVVIGDEAPAIVRQRTERTVKWAVDLLKREYFERDPDHVIDIWLFRDEASYRANAKKLWGREPSTPYGYYSSRERAMLMNIATGGGTLVHEIVHPFVAANFRECPAWFNEGLGSLYEQSEERDGRIVGLTNWRLAGLQAAIQRGGLGSFEQLTGTSTSAFYGADRGVNYAQARYLCLYLQEKGLLTRFYREFRANHEKDASGYETLKRVLDENDMAAFQERWEAWVMGLRFP